MIVKPVISAFDTMPFPQKTHKYLNTQVKDPQEWPSQLSAPENPEGLRSQPPTSCGSEGFIPFSLHDKQPTVLGQALPTEQQCWDAADPSEAGRSVPEHNICRSCFIGIFPTRSDYQISFCHICKWIGWGCETQCLGAWPSVKTVSEAQFWITVRRWLFWFSLALTGSRS